MLLWLLKRLSVAIPTFFVITILAWILTKNLPGDAAERWVASHISQSLSGDEIKGLIIKKKIEFGLYKPLFFFNIKQCSPTGWKRFVTCFVWNGTDNQFAQDMYKLFSFNWGKSLVDNRPVSLKLKSNLKYTLAIILPSYLISFLIAIPIGLRLNTDLYLNQFWSRFIQKVCLFFITTPSYILSICLILLFANPNLFYWFPEGGIKPVGEINPGFLDTIPFLTLPILSITLPLTSFFIILLKDYSQEQTKKPYILTAKSKGLPIQFIVNRHLFPNSLTPLITTLGVLLPSILSGSVILEQIFNIPGMGSEMIQACFSSDYPMVLVVFSFFGLLTIIGVLLSDFLIILANPKLSFNKNGR